MDPKVPARQTPVRPVPVHLKEAFRQELDKILQAGYIKPAYEATPRINSHVIVEGKNKLCVIQVIVVICEPWFFKTPDDIAHMLVDVSSQQQTVQRLFDMKPWMKSLPV